ncbi:MAG: hypothetical protein Q4P32_03490 [Micrococcales bacterium]|nr:hypothetical protein [Micrococcales bacterium]
MLQEPPLDPDEASPVARCAESSLHLRAELLDLADVLASIAPDVGHDRAQAGVDAALAAAGDVVGRWL